MMGAVDRILAQEEYNNLSPEGQNALFAIEVLGWKLNEDDEWTMYLEHFDNYLGIAGENMVTRDVHNFDPNNNLDHAFMGVDTFLPEYNFILRYVPMRKVGEVWEAWLIPKKSGISKNRNEAVMLAYLKAKGVVD